MTIIKRFDGINPRLLNWFFIMQANHPEMHVSEAGRDQETQEEKFKQKASRAHWGQSAHNYNCAIDVFCILDGSHDIYDEKWFHEVLAPEIPDYLEWYGAPGAEFYELPHLEIRGWKELVKKGFAVLVEKKGDW
jgi:hypothetical protein